MAKPALSPTSTSRSLGAGDQSAAGDGGDEDLGEVAPQVVDDHLDAAVAGLGGERVGELVVQLVQGNGGVGAKVAQVVEQLRVAPGGHDVGAELLGELDAEAASDAGGAEHQDGLTEEAEHAT